jgi:PKD repeat protein
MLITTFSYIFPIKISVANQPPDIPEKPTPSNGTIDVNISVVFHWLSEDPNGDPVTYDVYFGASSPPVLVEENLSDPFYDPPGDLNYSTHYFWKIIAMDNQSASTEGPQWEFTTIEKSNQPPHVPDNEIPENGTIDVNISVVFHWLSEDPDGDPVTYDVYFGASSPPELVEKNLSDPSYDPPGDLNYSTHYFWKIIAMDNQSASTEGPLWDFTTKAKTNNPPNTPDDETPQNDSTNVSIDVNLNWIGGDPDIDDTVTYDIYFGTSNPPPKLVDNQSDMSYNPNTLLDNTTHYWRIVAWDNNGAFAIGPLWHFITGIQHNQPPNVPTALSPVNDSTGVSVNTDLSWQGGDPDPGDTVKYDVFFGTSNPPQKKIHNQTTTSYDPGTMSYSTTYYWKIIAWDSHLNFSTSGLFHFTTTIHSGGGGEEPPQPPQNIKPIAHASVGGPYQKYVNSPILFDGSNSYDPDGNITNWFWDFGDNTNANGVSVFHSFLEARTYTVTLTVTDNKGATNTDTTTCVIRQLNKPPTKPTITGPTSGSKNTMYTYTAASTDPDKDPLLYTFEWGGSISQLSGFLPNGMNYSVNHSWTEAGRYNLTVKVTDNQSNQSEVSSKITIYIDAIQTRGAGYLYDNDGDGLYDAFYSDETHQTVSIQRKGDSYLIDKNGDGTWEYVYNATYGLTSYQEPRKTPGYDLIFTLGAIAAVILLSRKRKTL